MNWRVFFRWAAHAQMLPVLESGEETLVGGQAVMEGVMMRAPHSYSVAVRRPDGSLAVEESPLPKISEKYPIFKYPLFRGIGTLGHAMWLGIKALRFSADVALEAEAAKEAASGKQSVKEMPEWAMWLQIALSLGFFIVMYKLIPLVLTTQLEKSIPALHGRVLFNLVDGVIRMLIFVMFLWVMARMKDIHRVFEYHGAEHKVVFNFESGQPLSVENAQKFVTWHPRCGTSFLLVVMLVSIAVYALLPFDGFMGRFLGRVLLIPVIAGLSYEMIRFAARNRGGLLALITAPGLWLQRITTQPPSDSQTEVAIHALKGAMALEAKQGGELVIA